MGAGVKNQCEALYIINSTGIAYHQLRKKLYIIKPTEMHTFGVMRYNNGKPLLMIYSLTRDDMPSLSAWIKNSKSEDLEFLALLPNSEP